MLAHVAEMGYEGVEFAGYYSWPAEKIRKVLDQNKLQCCGTHTGLPTLTGDQLAKTIEFNKILGNKNLISPSGMRTNSQETCIQFAKQMSEIAAKAKEQGMRVGYHNHAGEFDAKGGFIPWEVFASNSSKDVILQVDIGHVARSGADPAKYMVKFPGRLITVHVKDFAKGKSEDPVIGEGDVDWPAMFKHLRRRPAAPSGTSSRTKAPRSRCSGSRRTSRTCTSCWRSIMRKGSSRGCRLRSSLRRMRTESDCPTRLGCNRLIDARRWKGELLW